MGSRTAWAAVCSYSFTESPGLQPLWVQNHSSEYPSLSLPLPQPYRAIKIFTCLLSVSTAFSGIHLLPLGKETVKTCFRFRIALPHKYSPPDFPSDAFKWNFRNIKSFLVVHNWLVPITSDPTIGSWCLSCICKIDDGNDWWYIIFVLIQVT